MFTGIIRDLGTVESISEGNKSRRMTIRTALDLNAFEIGASICCDGCCLTLVEKGKDGFIVDVGAETLALTTLASWKAGHRVNLEPSLRMGDELGGHMVSGHIDGLAMVDEVRADGESWRLTIRAPDTLAAYIAPKGSIALNGISLTVNEVEGPRFGICIIPHTWAVTNISGVKPGNLMNIEIDQMARYVARMLSSSLSPAGRGLEPAPAKAGGEGAYTL